MLKYKPTFDAEAIIIGYKKGQGKYSGMLGGFICKQLTNHDTYMSIDHNENHIFAMSGMDDDVRKTYKQTHPIGTIISYACSGKTDTGKPRFARYVRFREDVTIQEHILDNSSRENVIRCLKEMGQFERNNGELFKASSYFRAAKGIEDIPLTEESILSVKGIGKGLCKKILEIVDTGTCEFYEKIKDFKDPRTAFLDIYGVGTKKANDLVSMGFTTIESIRKADNVTEILNNKQQLGLTYYDDINQRIPRSEIVEHELLLNHALHEVDPNSELTIAGSYRRGMDTSGDIDILVKMNDKKTFGTFIKYLKSTNYITEELAKGQKNLWDWGNYMRFIDGLILCIQHPKNIHLPSYILQGQKNIIKK